MDIGRLVNKLVRKLFFAQEEGRVVYVIGARKGGQSLTLFEIRDLSNARERTALVAEGQLPLELGDTVRVVTNFWNERKEYFPEYKGSVCHPIEWTYVDSCHKV